MPKKETTKVIAKNRRAFHDYEILQTYEAGVVLTGTEVCSLRENNCQLTDCFALIRKGEVWVNNLHISPYSHGNLNNPIPTGSASCFCIEMKFVILSVRRRKKAWRWCQSRFILIAIHG